MGAGEVGRTTATIGRSGAQEHFTASGEVVLFDGFLKLYAESTDDDNNATPLEEAVLPAMKKGDRLDAKKITATERFTQPPARYSEATLVKKLEELGIGRPSTYAPTISTIMNRGYAIKQSREGVKREYDTLTLQGGKITQKTAS